MIGKLEKEFLRCFVEESDLARVGRVIRALLTEDLDHHIIRRLIDTGQKHGLTVDEEVSVSVLLYRLFADLPDEIPGERFGKRKSELFNKVLFT